MSCYVLQSPDRLIPDEQFADHETALLRLEELGPGANRLLWFCGESVGPWQARKAAEDAKTGPVSDLQADLVSLDDRDGFEDWTRRLIEAANEGMSA